MAREEEKLFYLKRWKSCYSYKFNRCISCLDLDLFLHSLIHPLIPRVRGENRSFGNGRAAVSYTV